jgi:hypothetical protein
MSVRRGGSQNLREAKYPENCRIRGFEIGATLSGPRIF